MLICLLGKAKLVLNNKKGCRIMLTSISVMFSAVGTIRLNCKLWSALPRCLCEKSVDPASSFSMLELHGKSPFVYFSFAKSRYSQVCCEEKQQFKWAKRAISSISSGLPERAKRGDRCAPRTKRVRYPILSHHFFSVSFCCSPILLVQICMI